MVSIPSLIEDSTRDFHSLKSDICICPQTPRLTGGCTARYKHVREVTTNLLNNVPTPLWEKGTINHRLHTPPKWDLGLSVRIRHWFQCSGQGSSSSLFAPYYTTKTTNHHMGGLALYYCRNVMLNTKDSSRWKAGKA